MSLPAGVPRPPPSIPSLPLLSELPGCASQILLAPGFNSVLRRSFRALLSTGRFTRGAVVGRPWAQLCHSCDCARSLRAQKGTLNPSFQCARLAHEHHAVCLCVEPMGFGLGGGMINPAPDRCTTQIYGPIIRANTGYTLILLT